MAAANVHLRAETAADAAFVEGLLVERYEGAMASWPLSGVERLQLARLQARAQAEGHRAARPGARGLVVEAEGVRVGRLVLDDDRAVEGLVIVDLAVAAEARGRGLGGAVVGFVQEEARRRGCPVRLRVAWDNEGARRLYERCGFRACGGEAGEPHVAMIWSSAPVEDGLVTLSGAPVGRQGHDEEGELAQGLVVEDVGALGSDAWNGVAEGQGEAAVVAAGERVHGFENEGPARAAIRCAQVEAGSHQGCEGCGSPVVHRRTSDAIVSSVPGRSQP